MLCRTLSCLVCVLRSELASVYCAVPQKLTALGTVLAGKFAV